MTIMKHLFCQAVQYIHIQFGIVIFVNLYTNGTNILPSLRLFQSKTICHTIYDITV